MKISPAGSKVGGSGEAVPTAIKPKDINICRICQSPEEPDNPLRHPCACRGSLKYVHTDCLFLWINRRRSKNCEICRRKYSIVPVYAENAPEKLPCHEFLKGLLVRSFSLMTLILPWLLMIPLNTYLSSFLPQKKSKRVFPGLFYTVDIAASITLMVVLMGITEEFVRRHPHLLRYLILLENGLRDSHVTEILLLLSNYLRVLCDWWHDQLLHLPFIHVFERGRFAVALVPRNTQLREFGAIRNFLFFLDDNTFAVVAINICWSLLYTLLPYSIGRIVLVLLRCCFPQGWIWENVSEVTFGCIIMFSLCFAYLGSLVVTLPRNTFPDRLRWVKITSILCFKIGVMPWILGCWLDFCTFPVSGRLEVISDYPRMAAKHWYTGICYLGFALRCMELIQKMVQKRAFWNLIDVTEPNYNITKLHLGSILFAFAFHGEVVVIVLYLPIKTITLINNSFFPLQFEEELGFALLVTYMSLVIAGPRWLGNSIIPSIKPVVQKWIITLSSWLKLSDFLLGVAQTEVFNRNVSPLFKMFGIAEGSIVSLYASSSGEEDIDKKRDQRFIVRIGVMLVLAALSMFLVSTIFMALPVLVGRGFFHSISFFIPSFGLKHDDLCAFWIGFFILRGLYMITCFVYDHIISGRTNLLLNHILMYILITVIPVLLSLLFPSQVLLVESPVNSILGFPGVANLTVRQFICPTLLALIITWLSTTKHAQDLIGRLHQVEFDKQYKVGERLIDFNEENPN